MELDLTEEIQELREKDEAQLELDTAIKWTRRACAAYSLCSQAESKLEKLSWLMRGEDLMHEAVEHAGLVRDNGESLNRLQSVIDEYRNQALVSIQL